MPPDGSETLISHYIAELAYLRSAGSEFAWRYPPVARALEFTPQGSTDPHVQRLIESFAFLTARLQRTYEAQLPDVPAALLDNLYPQLTAPIPSMGIAAFQTDPDQSRSIAGITVPANTLLHARAESGGEELPCRFRTGYAVDLWPIEVADARVEPPTSYPFLDSRPAVQRVVRIRLRCQGRRRFSEFTPPSLRFFLSPLIGNREELYEMLFVHLAGIATIAADTAVPLPDSPAPAPTMLDGASLRQVGFRPEEAILPCPPMSHQAYRLLQEYFAFPDKFLFFDVAGLPPGAFGNGAEADLLMLISGAPRHSITVTADSFMLSCTPIINLFPRVSEPIRLDHTQLEYPLVADIRRKTSTGIHSIERVTRISAATGLAETIQPLFSFQRSDRNDSSTALYYARRQRARYSADEADEIMLSMLDPDLDPALPAGDTVFAHLLCTNGSLTDQMGRGTRLDLEIDLPVSGVSSVMRLTREVAPPAHGKALWNLVSHLSVNHLSITGGTRGVAALRETLKLYCRSNEAVSDRIDGLVGLSSRRVVRRIGADAWRGFCRGIEITLEFDAQRYADPGLWLMGSVLSRFFGLHASVNSFIELVLIRRSGSREEAWRWPAVTGETELL